MKALSVRQPWATFIAWGMKTIEVRSWTTNYRGPLLICASGRDVKTDDGFVYPAGYALAQVQLVDVRPLLPKDMKTAGLKRADFEDNLFAWVMENAWEIEPFTVSGRLGIYNIPDRQLLPLPGASEDYDHTAYFDEMRAKH